MNFLYDQYGRRKYLTIQERNAFLEAAKWMRADVYTFCALLAYSGARISEILALVPARFDFSEEAVVIECLKKRRRGVNRTVSWRQRNVTTCTSMKPLTGRLKVCCKQ